MFLAVCDPCPFEADDENDQDGDDIPDNCDPVRYLCASAPPSEFGPMSVLGWLGPV